MHFPRRKNFFFPPNPTEHPPAPYAGLVITLIYQSAICIPKINRFNFLFKNLLIFASERRFSMKIFIAVVIVLILFFLSGYVVNEWYESLSWKERRKFNHIFSDARKKRQLKRYARWSKRHSDWVQFFKYPK